MIVIVIVIMLNEALNNYLCLIGKKCKYLAGKSTVKTREPKIVAVVFRWSLFKCLLCNTNSKWDQKMVVVIGMWSLFSGER